MANPSGKANLRNPQDPLHKAGWQGMFDFYARHLG
jgi:hypothetical protein